MKTIVKIILLATLIVLPLTSEAKVTTKQWIELAENGYITKQEAATAIEKTELMHIEEKEKQLEYQKEIDIKESDNRVKRTAFEVIGSVLLLLIIGIVTIILFILITRSQHRKNEREKEFLMTLVDKGVLTQAQPTNLEIFLPQKGITEYNKFITDATMIGVGFGIGFGFSSTNLEYIVNIPSYILISIGAMRIIVRTIIAIIESIKNKRENRSKVAPNEPAADTETINEIEPENR